MIDRHLRTFYDRISALLDERPRRVDEIAADLEAQGLFDPLDLPSDDVLDVVYDVIDDINGIWISPQEIVVKLGTLLSGAVFTHRVTQSELERGMLDAHPDFAAVAWHEVEPWRLGDGLLDLALPELDEGAAEFGSLIGPDGWLDGFEPGDLVALRCTDGEARVERIDEAELASDADLVEALRGAFAYEGVEGEADDEADRAEAADDPDADRTEGADDPDDDQDVDRDDEHDGDDGEVLGEAIAALVFDVMCADAEAFRRPVRPLGELLADAGLEAVGDWCGPVGTDWLAPAAGHEVSELARVANRYDLEDCCLHELYVTLEAWNELVTATDPHDATDNIEWDLVVAALAHGYAAAAFADYVLRANEELPERFDDFVGALRLVGERQFAAAIDYVTARKFEQLGETVLAEQALLDAAAADPHYEPAVQDLAWYASDRGDAERAVLLLRRVGFTDDDADVDFLSSMRPRRNVAGRNERCPCGSGRKYKDCCARNPRLSLEDRADWLLFKLSQYMRRPRSEPIVRWLAAVTAPDDEAFPRVYQSDAPVDLAVFDGGMGAEFLAQRGALLPDEDRALLESWLAQPRKLFEVAEVEASAYDGRTLVLRDTTDSSSVTVTAPADQHCEPGDLMWARVVAVGDRNRLVGVPLVASPDERPLLEELVASEPQVMQLAMWLGGVRPQT